MESNKNMASPIGKPDFAKIANDFWPEYYGDSLHQTSYNHNEVMKKKCNKL